METEIKPGVYKHYGNQKLYRVHHVARDSSNIQQKWVVYTGLYDSEEFGDQPLWVRTLEEFLKPAVEEGKEVPRYLFIEA